MKHYGITILLMLTASTADADIFKCQVNGKSVYQASPCVTEESETALKIRTRAAQRDYYERSYDPSYIPGEMPGQPESPIMAQERMRLEREYKQSQIQREQAAAEFNRALARESETRQWEAERSAEQRDREIELQRQRDKAYQDHLKRQRVYR